MQYAESQSRQLFSMRQYKLLIVDLPEHTSVEDPLNHLPKTGTPHSDAGYNIAECDPSHLLGKHHEKRVGIFDMVKGYPCRCGKINKSTDAVRISLRLLNCSETYLFMPEYLVP